MVRTVGSMILLVMTAASLGDSHASPPSEQARSSATAGKQRTVKPNPTRDSVVTAAIARMLHVAPANVTLGRLTWIANGTAHPTLGWVQELHLEFTASRDGLVAQGQTTVRTPRERNGARGGAWQYERTAVSGVTLSGWSKPATETAGPASH